MRCAPRTFVQPSKCNWNLTCAHISQNCMEQFLQNMITPVQSSNSGTKGGGLFRTADGKNLFITFALVTSLFLLWGFCNGMIDILNKKFQVSLHINMQQSGLVQFANYLAYFLMAIPAGLIARKLGYKGGILVGIVLIASGAFWFIHAVSMGTY